MNILISSVGTSTSVNLIKLIKRCKDNHKITGMDINEYGYTSGSQLVDFYFKSPLFNDENYIDYLLDIINLQDIDIFIPVHDFEILKIAENIDKFKKCKVIIPTLDTLKEIEDKYICTNNMIDMGIKCPKEVNLNDNCKRIIRERISVGSRGINIIGENDKITKLPENSFVQKVIEGIEITVDILNDMYGKPLLIVPRERLEVKSGVATKVRIVKDTVLIEECKKILNKYMIPGFCNIQFIKDNNGENYFIEINPRYGGFSISSSLASFNVMDIFLNLENTKVTFEENMNLVKWNSIVTRYYEEVVYYEK